MQAAQCRALWGTRRRSSLAPPLTLLAHWLQALQAALAAAAAANTPPSVQVGMGPLLDLPAVTLLDLHSQDACCCHHVLGLWRGPAVHVSLKP